MINENKIMIVDDEPDILDLLEKAFMIEGFHNIIKVDNGTTAVDTCRKIQPDVIVLGQYRTEKSAKYRQV